jgi:hypothetical protein
MDDMWLTDDEVRALNPHLYLRAVKAQCAAIQGKPVFWGRHRLSTPDRYVERIIGWSAGHELHEIAEGLRVEVRSMRARHCTHCQGTGKTFHCLKCGAAPDTGILCPGDHRPGYPKHSRINLKICRGCMPKYHELWWIAQQQRPDLVEIYGVELKLWSRVAIQVIEDARRQVGMVSEDVRLANRRKYGLGNRPKVADPLEPHRRGPQHPLGEDRGPGERRRD